MLLALWLAPALARWLSLVGVPGAFALIAAFGGFVLAPFVGLHHLLSAVPDLARVEVSPRSDRFGGLAVGGLNGVLVVGIACVLWSVAPVPAWLRVRDLDDLKSKLIGVVVAIIAVVFVGVFVDSNREDEVVAYGLGAGVLVAGLAIFALATRKADKPSDKAKP